MSTGTGGAVARGMVWMLLARAGDRVGGVLSMAISARYLAPDDFGFFQMALSVIVLVEVFAMFGFEWSLIRHPDPRREHFDTAFTLQLIVAVLTCLAVLALAYPFAAYYRMPGLVPAIAVLALAPLISGFSNLATAHLRREMRFEADFWRMFVPRIVSVVSVIALAIWWQSFWALIVAILIGKVASVVMGYVMHAYRPRLSLATWRELLGFSAWVQLSGLIDGLRSRIGDLVIGRLLGTHSLAIFNMSNELANLPQTEFVGALNSAIYSKYARLQHDLGELRSAYSDVLGLTFLVGLPAAVGMMFTAPAAVRLLLGSAWMEAAPLIQIVAVGAFAAGIAANSPFVAMTVGRPNLATLLSALTLALLLAFLLLFTSRFGLKGAAAGFTLASVLMLPVHLWAMRSIMGFTLSDLWPRVWRPVVATSIMAAVLWQGMPDAPPVTILEAGITLVVAAVAGGVIYLLGLLLLWIGGGRPDGLETVLVSHVRDIASRAAGRLGLLRTSTGT